MWLTDTGVEIDLYSNKRTGARIVNTKQVYGDEMRPLLQAFYDRGARRFTYLGTAGALNPSFKVGDVLVPELLRSATGWRSFGNHAGCLVDGLALGAAVHRGVKHGWVQAILHETDGYLHRERAAGVQSLDVEAKHFGEFFASRKADASLVLFVSDQPLGKATLEKYSSSLVERALEPVIGRLVAR